MRRCSGSLRRSSDSAQSVSHCTRFSACSSEEWSIKAKATQISPAGSLKAGTSCSQALIPNVRNFVRLVDAYDIVSSKHSCIQTIPFHSFLSKLIRCIVLERILPQRLHLAPLCRLGSPSDVFLAENGVRDSGRWCGLFSVLYIMSP